MFRHLCGSHEHHLTGQCGIAMDMLLLSGQWQSAGKYCLGETYLPSGNRQRLASNSLLLSMQQNQCCQWQNEYNQSCRQGKNETCRVSGFWPKAAGVFGDYNRQLRLERQGQAGGVNFFLSRLLSMSHNCLWAELGTASSCHCGLVCLHLFSSQFIYTDTCPSLSHYKIFTK